MTSIMSQYPSGAPRHESEYRSLSPPYLAERNDFGLQKHRKAISTGGGRAWTEEEVSRSDVMPGRMDANDLIGSIPVTDTSE